MWPDPYAEFLGAEFQHFSARRELPSISAAVVFIFIPNVRSGIEWTIGVRAIRRFHVAQSKFGAAALRSRERERSGQCAR